MFGSRPIQRTLRRKLFSHTTACHALPAATAANLQHTPRWLVSLEKEDPRNGSAFVPRRGLFGLFGLGSSSVTGKGSDVEEEYEILEELGSGRYGTVKRAKRRSDGSFFAVKTIPKWVCYLYLYLYPPTRCGKMKFCLPFFTHLLFKKPRGQHVYAQERDPRESHIARRACCRWRWEIVHCSSFA